MDLWSANRPVEELEGELAELRSELAALRKEQEGWKEREARLKTGRNRAVKASRHLAEALELRLRVDAAEGPLTRILRRDGRVTKEERAQIELLRSSKLFDGKWYLMEYGDVVREGIDPALHYLRRPYDPLRQPSERFDTGQYLSDFPDVYRRRENPLLHFLSTPQADGAVSYPPRREA